MPWVRLSGTSSTGRFARIQVDANAAGHGTEQRGNNAKHGRGHGSPLLLIKRCVRRHGSHNGARGGNGHEHGHHNAKCRRRTQGNAATVRSHRVRQYKHKPHILYSMMTSSHISISDPPPYLYQVVISHNSPTFFDCNITLWRYELRLSLPLFVPMCQMIGRDNHHFYSHPVFAKHIVPRFRCCYCVSRAHQLFCRFRLSRGPGGHGP